MNDIELWNKITETGKNYKGPVDPLRNAIGTAFLCQMYGWKVGKIVHSYRAWKRYQKILEIDFEKEFPDKTTESRKSVGFRIYEGTNRLWETMQGKSDSLGKRREITDLS